MGIFGNSAGDFPRFGQPKQRNRSVETGGKSQKPAVGGAFWHSMDIEAKGGLPGLGGRDRTSEWRNQNPLNTTTKSMSFLNFPQKVTSALIPQR
jgi:hypothetical protein